MQQIIPIVANISFLSATLSLLSTRAAAIFCDQLVIVTPRSPFFGPISPLLLSAQVPGVQKGESTFLKIFAQQKPRLKNSALFL